MIESIDTEIRELDTRWRSLRAFACLRKHGDQEPYFSLTGEEFIRDDAGHIISECCGQMHEALLKEWPDLQPLVNLHLSTIDGVPMYAMENGYYWLAGAAAGLGERYHGGNGDDGKSNEKCLAILADHFRITHIDAEMLIATIKKVYCDTYCFNMMDAKGSDSHMSPADIKDDLRDSHIVARKAARAALQEWIDGQIPRWKREALSCIEEFKLSIVE